MKPYHNNPRRISDKQLADLGTWLAELGDLSGIVHDLNSDMVVGGNQRSRIFNINECEIVLTEQYAHPDEQGTVGLGYVLWQGNKYAYRQVRWDERQAEKANIVANRAGGEWDFEILANNFQTDDLLAWGFEPVELGIAEPKPELKDAEPQIDRAAELQAHWGTATGQLWQLGEHRLIRGDCTDAGVVARVFARGPEGMGGERAALVVTSPPYNQQLQSQSKPTGMHKENRWFHRLENAYSDAMPEDRYQDWQVAILDLWFDFVADGGACFYNHKHRYRDRRPIIPIEWIGRTRWQLRQEIIWDRRGGVAANANMFIPGDERIYWLEKDGDHVWNGIGNNRTTVWAMNPQTNDGTHVCPFPMELASIPIECVSNRGDVVGDPFAGSGTTGIACHNLGRRARMVEISPAYCAVILERFAAIGVQPELSAEFQVIHNE